WMRTNRCHMGGGTGHHLHRFRWREGDDVDFVPTRRIQPKTGRNHAGKLVDFLLGKRPRDHYAYGNSFDAALCPVDLFLLAAVRELKFAVATRSRTRHLGHTAVVSRVTARID